MSDRSARPVITFDSLEPRRLFSDGPATPSLSASLIDADSVVLTYSCSDGSNLEFEAMMPGDENYWLTYGADPSPGQHTLEIDYLGAGQTYAYRLRADKDGLTEYAQASVTTPSPEENAAEANYLYDLPTPGGLNLALDQFAYDMWTDIVYDASFTGDYSDFGTFTTGGVTLGAQGWRVDDPYHVYYPSFGMGGFGAEYGTGVNDHIVQTELNHWAGSTVKGTIWAQVEGDSDVRSHSVDFSVTAPGEMNEALTLEGDVDADGDLILSWSGGTPAGLDVAMVDIFQVDASGTKADFVGYYNGNAGFADIGPATGGQFFAVYGGSGYSNFVNADGTDSQPSTVYEVSATLGSAKDQARVVWSNDACNEDHYRVMIRPTDDPDAEWTSAKTVGKDITSAKITLPDPKKTYDISVVAVNGNTESDIWTVVEQSGVYLQSVSFNSQGIARDNGKPNYGGPQWFDTDGNGTIQTSSGITAYSNGTIDNPAAASGLPPAEEQFPISYVRSTPGLDSFISAGVILPYTGTIGAGWTLEGSGGGCTFSATPVAAGGGGIYANFTSTTKLPDTIDSKDLEITWKLSTGGTTPIDLGKSKNHLYVTGVSGGAFETALDLGCDGAKGKHPHEVGEAAAAALVNDEAVLGGVWNKFKGLSTKRVNGDIMKYWGAISSIDYPNKARDDENYSYQGLLKYADGRCGAWSRLFENVAAVQGVALTHRGITPGAGAVATGPAGRVYVGTLIDVGNAAAQGGAATEHIFTDHAVSEFNGKVYDPSYGLLKTSRQAWEDAAVLQYLSRYANLANLNDVVDAPLADPKGTQETDWE